MDRGKEECEDRGTRPRDAVLTQTVQRGSLAVGGGDSRARTPAFKTWLLTCHMGLDQLLNLSLSCLLIHKTGLW